MEIPYQALNPETLNNLIEELVTRDGTDYGECELTLEQKVDQVRRRLVDGEAFICYDEKSELCEIILKP